MLIRDKTKLLGIPQDLRRSERRASQHDGKPSRYYAAAVSPDGRLISAIDMAGAVADVWSVM